MPVHQLNGLACQCPFDVGDKFVKVQDMLSAGFTKADPPFFTVRQIIQKTLTSQPHQFAGHNLTRHNALRVAYAFNHFCHD